MGFRLRSYKELQKGKGTFCIVQMKIRLFTSRKSALFYQLTVMGRTPFYRTSNELERHFLNIERTQTCSSIGDRTQTPEFWLRTNGHQT